MWGIEGGRVLVLSAGQGATKHKDGGPSLLGSRTVFERKSGVKNWARGNRITGVEAGEVASSPDKSLRPHRPRSQHLVTAAQRDLWGKKNSSILGMCVRPSAHPTSSFLLKPSTLPQVHRVCMCMARGHICVWWDPSQL